MSLSLLCAAAFGPVMAVAAGITGGVAVAGIGVLSSVGGGVLGDLVAGTINRLRPRGSGEPSQAEMESELSREIQQLLDAGDASTQSLRADIAAVLQKIDAGGTALRAAVEAGNEQVRGDVVTVMGELGTGFGELRFLVGGVERAAAEIQESLDSQDAKLRVLIDQNGRQLTEARLTREAVHMIELRARESAGREGMTGEGWRPHSFEGCPYRGLLPFDEAHAEVFYGRERLTAELVGKVAGRLTGTGLVVVTGASGAGKSSLVRAGLLPALARGLQLPGSASWPRLVITPTGDPIAELATHLAALGGTDAVALRDLLVSDPGQAHLAVRQAVVAEAGRRGHGSAFPGRAGARLVLVVDQFEQLFTLNPGEGGESYRQAFVAALCAAASTPGGPGGSPPALEGLGGVAQET